jgi:hypothetical protein
MRHVPKERGKIRATVEPAAGATAILQFGKIQVSRRTLEHHTCRWAIWRLPRLASAHGRLSGNTQNDGKYKALAAVRDVDLVKASLF